jgi:predicted Zn finger-like uncharacterized protein
MYTRCTHCDTWFTIGADHLRQGRGEVRCGSCMRSFNALASLYERLPEGLSLSPDDDDPAELADLTVELAPGTDPERRPGPEPAPAEPSDPAEPRSAPPLPGMAKIGPSIGDIGTLTLGDDPRPRPTSAAERAAPAGRRATPPVPLGPTDRGERAGPSEQGGASDSGDPVDLDGPTRPGHAPFAHPVGGRGETRRSSRSPSPGLPHVLRDDLDRLGRARAARRHGWIYATLSVLLVLALVGQYAWFLPDDLAKRYPSTRPWLQPFCAATGCALPAVRQPSLIRLTSRDVRIHPKYEGALLVSAALVNTAASAQPFPTVVFTVFNVNGQTIASRAFAPSDYLDAEPPADGMPPHRPVQIVLELLAPEEAAVSFEFRFI